MHTCFYHALASCRIALIGATLAFSFSARADIDIKMTEFELSKPTAIEKVPFVTLDGKETSLSEQKGKIRVLHFWATWCVPCVMELPAVNKTQKAYEEKGLNIIAISLDGVKNAPKIEKYLKDKELSALNVFIDNNTAAFRAAKVNGMPSSIFINEKGEEIARFSGALNWEGDALKKFLDKELSGK